MASQQGQPPGGKAQVFRRIFEESAIGIVLMDPEGCILESNPAFARMVGYSPDELRGKTVAQLTHPEDWDAELASLRQTLRQHDRTHTFRTEKRYLHKDGHIVWGRLTGSVIWDARGEPVFGLGLVEDVTEQRRARQALEESEERYRLLFSEMLSGFALHELVCDAQGRPVDFRFLEVNPAFERITGWRREQVIGRTIRELLPGVDDAWIERAGAVAQTGMGRHEEFHFPPLGKHLDVIIYSPRAGQFAVMFQDITPRLEAERRLAAEHERLAVTLRSIGDGVIATDAHGVITLLNPAAEVLTGWPQDEAQGRSLEEVFRVRDHANRNPYQTLVADVLTGRRAMESLEPLVLVSRKGTERIVGATSSAIRDREGAIQGVVLAFRDITEKQQREEEQIRADRLDSLGYLAGGIAHDFNNLLTVILGNLSLAQADAARENPELAALLAPVEQAALQARDLTRQLLTFSKGGAPIKKSMRLDRLIREAAGFALRGATSRAVFDIAEDLWPAEVDADQFAQVIRALVIRADRAMPGGGTLNIRAENLVLQENGSMPLPTGNYVKIAITDTGEKIPPEHQQKIFDPYFSPRDAQGGLGLASSRSIIRRHGGHITLRSDKATGTTFEIYLPASRMPAETASAPVPSAAPPTRERVLVMDDEPAIRDLLLRVLAGHGYEAAAAADGAEAVRLHQQALREGRPFQVVVLDLTIPGGMSGKETLRRLRELDPGVRAIVSSGYSTDPVMSNCREFGFQGVIVKPYQAQALLDTVRSVLTQPP